MQPQVDQDDIASMLSFDRPDTGAAQMGGGQTFGQTQTLDAPPMAMGNIDEAGEYRPYRAPTLDAYGGPEDEEYYQSQKPGKEETGGWGLMGWGGNKPCGQRNGAIQCGGLWRERAQAGR